jgi:hypothetical protein
MGLLLYSEKFVHPMQAHAGDEDRWHGMVYSELLR